MTVDAVRSADGLVFIVRCPFGCRSAFHHHGHCGRVEIHGPGGWQAHCGRGFYHLRIVEIENFDFTGIEPFAAALYKLALGVGELPRHTR